MKYLSTALLIVTALLATETTSAFSAFPVGSSSMSSSFGGSVLVTGKAETSSSSSSYRGVASLEMKKGKENVPAQMRSQYRRQKEMAKMREQMIEAQRPGPDGLPVFNLFVRTKRANMWYPCGSFKGDDRSAALCSSYRDNGLLAGISKKQLDSGVSGSLYRDKDKLIETICRGYPQLRKSKDELEFGYRLAYEGLSEDQSKINVIEVKEQKGLLDNIKSMFAQ